MRAETKDVAAVRKSRSGAGRPPAYAVEELDLAALLLAQGRDQAARFLGTYALQSGRPADAVGELEFAARMLTDDLATLENLGLAYEAVGDAQKAASALPCSSTILWTICGSMSRPPFAMAHMAVVTCNGVAPTSWPMGTRVIESFDHVCGGCTVPPISPGSAIPVRSPKPNLRTYE